MIQMVCSFHMESQMCNMNFQSNAECLFENMKEESLIVCRQIYDVVEAKEQ